MGAGLVAAIYVASRNDATPATQKPVPKLKKRKMDRDVAAARYSVRVTRLRDRGPDSGTRAVTGLRELKASSPVAPGKKTIKT